MTSRKIDLNADVGEGADDAPLYQIVSSVNIACGAHAGDEQTMITAIEEALEHGVAIGAHPGYPDPKNLGRKEMSLPLTEVTELVAGQVRTLIEIATARHARVGHVKPHGALYNQAAKHVELARAIVTGVRMVDPSLLLVGLAASKLIEAARASGLDAVEEGFCDRAYEADGTLVPREEPGSLIRDVGQASAQAGAPPQRLHLKALRVSGS